VEKDNALVILADTKSSIVPALSEIFEHFGMLPSSLEDVDAWIERIHQS
jgi:hypothetical protein